MCVCGGVIRDMDGFICRIVGQREEERRGERRGVVCNESDISPYALIRFCITSFAHLDV